MSDNLPVTILSDLTKEENEAVDKYVLDGLPNISSMTDSGLKLALNLYLEGQTFSSISQRVNVKKVIIMYLARKYGWLELKEEHRRSLMSSVVQRIQTAKVEGMDHLADLAFASKKYFQNKLDDYKKTGNDVILETLDPKIVSMYHKTIELLFKLGDISPDSPPKQDSPAVNINVGSGATISQNDDKTITVTPHGEGSDASFKSAIAALAAISRMRDEILDEQNKKKDKNEE